MDHLEILVWVFVGGMTPILLLDVAILMARLVRFLLSLVREKLFDLAETTESIERDWEELKRRSKTKDEGRRTKAEGPSKTKDQLKAEDQSKAQDESEARDQSEAKDGPKGSFPTGSGGTKAA